MSCLSTVRHKHLPDSCNNQASWLTHLSSASSCTTKRMHDIHVFCASCGCRSIFSSFGAYTSHKQYAAHTYMSAGTPFCIAKQQHTSVKRALLTPSRRPPLAAAAAGGGASCCCCNSARPLGLAGGEGCTCREATQQELLYGMYIRMQAVLQQQHSNQLCTTACITHLLTCMPKHSMHSMLLRTAVCGL